MNRRGGESSPNISALNPVIIAGLVILVACVIFWQFGPIDKIKSVFNPYNSSRPVIEGVSEIAYDLTTHQPAYYDGTKMIPITKEFVYKDIQLDRDIAGNLFYQFYYPTPRNFYRDITLPLFGRELVTPPSTDGSFYGQIQGLTLEASEGNPGWFGLWEGDPLHNFVTVVIRNTDSTQAKTYATFHVLEDGTLIRGDSYDVISKDVQTKDHQTIVRWAVLWRDSILEGADCERFVSLKGKQYTVRKVDTYLVIDLAKEANGIERYVACQNQQAPLPKSYIIPTINLLQNEETTNAFIYGKDAPDKDPYLGDQLVLAPEDNWGIEINHECDYASFSAVAKNLVDNTQASALSGESGLVTTNPLRLSVPLAAGNYLYNFVVFCYDSERHEQARVAFEKEVVVVDKTEQNFLAKPYDPASADTLRIFHNRKSTPLTLTKYGLYWGGSSIGYVDTTNPSWTFHINNGKDEGLLTKELYDFLSKSYLKQGSSELYALS